MISQFSGAVMDAERKHRFLLWRFWDERPRMLFIGLNPSTADEITADPTIRRLCGFAQRWGYGGLYACNLYSQITPYPTELLLTTRNHMADTPAVQMALGLSVFVLCGWGDGVNQVSQSKERIEYICGLIDEAKCFGFTKHGNPKHPLYLSYESELVDYIMTTTKPTEKNKGEGE